MATVKRQITIIRIPRAGAAALDKEYRVVGARNTTSPRMKALLSEEEVNSLIDAGTEVIIRALATSEKLTPWEED